jgi:hypothetical protein
MEQKSRMHSVDKQESDNFPWSEENKQEREMEKSKRENQLETAPLVEFSLCVRRWKFVGFDFSITKGPFRLGPPWLQISLPPSLVLEKRTHGGVHFGSLKTPRL